MPRKSKRYWTACIDVIAVKHGTKYHARHEVREPEQLNAMEPDINAAPIGKRILNKTDAYNAAREIFKNLACEAFVSIMLDNSNEIIGAARLSIGVSNQCTIFPRQIFAAALLSGASSIIVAHNHPGNNTEPSSADWSVTKHIKTAGAALDIPLLDHIIITDQEIISMKSQSKWGTL